eukprot:351133-Chlamydomonas_euryale.AAC.9
MACLGAVRGGAAQRRCRRACCAGELPSRCGVWASVARIFCACARVARTALRFDICPRIDLSASHQPCRKPLPAMPAPRRRCSAPHRPAAAVAVAAAVAAAATAEARCQGRHGASAKRHPDHGLPAYLCHINFPRNLLRLLGSLGMHRGACLADGLLICCQICHPPYMEHGACVNSHSALRSDIAGGKSAAAALRMRVMHASAATAARVDMEKIEQGAHMQT